MNFKQANNIFIFFVINIFMLIKSTLFISLIKPNFLDMSVSDFYHLIFIYISFILIISSFYFFIKSKNRIWYLYFINIFFTIIFFLDLIYFKGFKEFPSLLHFKELVNISEFKDGITSLINPNFFILFIDNLLLLPICFLKSKTNIKIKRNPIMFIFILICFIGCFSNKYNRELYDKIKFDPTLTVLTQSPIGYHIYDIYAYFKYETYKPRQEDIDSTINWLAQNKEDLPDNEYKGIFKGKNLLAIQFESLEGFVINEKVDGQEITPNLNKLLKNSLYFNNYNEAINGGGTSDAEFISNTSIYPIRKGAVAFLYPNIQDKNSLPNILKDNNYSTYIYHSDNFSYWNWGQINKSIGFENLYQESDYNGDEYTSMGLSDGCFLNKATEYIEQQKQPYYSFVVTMTSHMPFKLPEEYNELKLDDSINNTHLGDYFQAIHYTDKQLGIMLDKLDKDGYLENTIVTIHGDHSSVHRFYKDDILKMENIPDNWKEANHKIPLVVYQKKYENPKTISTYGNETDYLPTICYLLGIDNNYYKDTSVGKVLVNTNKNYTLLNSGTILNDNDISETEKEHVLQSFEISDKLIKIDSYNK